MSVAEVWGRIQNSDALLISQEGDIWTFNVPSWVTGPIIVEFWAKDDVGNITFRAGIFSIEDGTKKCVIRWLDDYGECKMISTERCIEMMDMRPTITMQEHACALMED